MIALMFEPHSHEKNELHNIGDKPNFLKLNNITSVGVSKRHVHFFP